jgi:ABC-type multidrug transport system fused ATPase/permease subunit
MAKQFRGLSVVVQMVSNMPTTFSALVSFAAYSIKASVNHTAPLSTAQAFTAFSILTLLTAPASQLLQAIPQLTSGMGCVRRVHAFISLEAFDDHRDVSGGAHRAPHFDDNDKDEKDLKDEKHEKADDRDIERSSLGSQSPVLTVSNLVLRSATTIEKSKYNSISFEASRGSLTTVIGPVGCGKTTLLRTVLGELRPNSGSISVRTPYIAYCSQNPWLPNGRIKDLIIGANEIDEKWYSKVISICDLESDFNQMPDNDLTIVGNRGIVISGGQKHRVCLARALYSRCSLMVLDDFLSSLDRKTQHQILNRLFEKDGFLQQYGGTILLATHITHHIHLSENLVVMGPSGLIKYVGPPEQWLNENQDMSALTEIESARDPPPTSSMIEKYKAMRSGRKTLLPAAGESETVKRQTGDFGVWVYYARAIGAWPLIFALVSVAVSVFTSNFPSKLARIPFIKMELSKLTCL